MELGGECQDGAATLLEMGGYVDDKSGPDGSVSCGVEDFEGPVGLSIDWQLLEAGEKAGFVAERGRMVVVWVASFPIRKNDSFGAELADDCGEAEFVLAAGLDVRVGDAEGAAPADAKDLGGLGGFFGARF